MKTISITIPKQLAESLTNSTLTAKQKSICISLYKTLLNKIDSNTDEWFPLSGSILAANYGNDYSKCLHFLISEGIISRSSSYSPGVHSYFYKLNSNIFILSSSFIYDYYNREKKACKGTSTVKEKQITKVLKSSMILQQTNINLKKLKFDYDKAFAWIDSQPETDSLCIVKKLQWKTQLEAIRQKIFFCSRNTTNTRLDTNITNIKGELLKFATLDGQSIAQFDLANSQLVFLVQLMKANTVGKEKEIEELEKHICAGKFYDLVSNLLNLSGKKEAKKLTFLLLFSKASFKSPLKSKLRKALPFLVDFCDSYKLSNGDNQLAITLQKMEANLFIDGILKELLKNDLVVLSKHDSIICKGEDASLIEMIMYKHLDNCFGDACYELKKENL